MPTWEELRAGVYEIDGSWRDIYVLHATREDWPWLKVWSRSRIYQMSRPNHVPESHLECVNGILIA